MAGACIPRCSQTQQETEAHVFFEPHDVAGSPGVVEEATMDALVEVGLGTREIQRRLFPQRDQGSIERFYMQRPLRVFVPETLGDGMQMPAARSDHIKGRDLLAGFVHAPPARI